MKPRILIGFLGLILLASLAGVLNSCSKDEKNTAKEQTEIKQLYTCPMHPDVITEEPGECPKCGMELVPVKNTAQTSMQHEGHDHEVQTTEGGETQLWTCGMHPEVILEEPGQCPKCGMNLVPLKTTTSGEKTSKSEKGKGKILYWRAPMDPTEIYDRPGKSKMGMDLIPVYEGEAELGAGGTITIDPVTVQNMGVRTKKVIKKDFYHVVRTVGYIEYDETRLFTINNKISGWVEKLYVDYTGKLVKKGQPLLAIYSPELVTTQEEYLLALKNLQAVKNSNISEVRQSAEELLKGSIKRLQYWDIPQQEIDRLTQGGQAQKTVTLYAPFTGFVIHKNVVEGSKVKAGQDLFRLADLSNVWIQASIYDTELPWIKIGAEAQIELSYLPGKTFEGKITYIYPYLNKKARDVSVRLEFPNHDYELKPGMYANVIIKTDPIKDALVVPTEAVIRSGKRNVVFIARGEGRFEPRNVKIGEENEQGELRIIAGLLEGEEIVTSAQFLFDSESRLQEAIQKMLAETRKGK
ncbi:MAG: efflux RND transporter periplasmic adaptor subunit [Caldisericaceae bacterium]|nr:efflux RND transporter periplasmic adaptor subunit [Caldisericaceae bacterium]